MKKILTIFMTVVITLALAGCGNKADQAADSQGGSRGAEEEASRSTEPVTGQGVREEVSQNADTVASQSGAGENAQSTSQSAGGESGSAREDGNAGSQISSDEDAGAQQAEITELRDDYKDNFDVDEKEAAAFGRMIKEAVAQKDVEMLAELTGFPVYVGLSGGIVVETREDFIALDVEELLSDEMVSSIADADENSLSPSMAGFTLYGSDGAPSITFGVREGRLAISGINYGF